MLYQVLFLNIKLANDILWIATSHLHAPRKDEAALCHSGLDPQSR